MSFLLTVNKDGAKYTPTQTVRPIPVCVDEKKQKLLVGYAYGGKEAEVLGCGWENDPVAMQAYDGSMVLISWGDTVVLCSDLMASEKVYYYHGDHSLLVSDDFWDIIRAIQPTFSDVDEANIKARMTIGSAFMNEGTVIKNLSILLPATKVEYDVIADELKSSRYHLCRFSGEVTDMNEAAENIGRALDATMQSIKEKYGDVVYGLGLSGGLDSRLALHYALKNGMRVRCFNICKLRPNGVLLARSVRNAKKLADLYSVPITFVEWDPKQIGTVKELQTRRYPDGPTQEAARDIYKFVPDRELDFDVLLTGGMGMGQQLFATHYDVKESFTLSQVMKYAEDMILYFNSKSRINNGLHQLFGVPFKEDTFRYPWERRLFLSPREDINGRAEAAVETIMNGGTSYFETVFNFRGWSVGFYSCNGAFESVYSFKPAYSIYSSFVMKQALRCSAMLLQHRALLRGTIMRNLPESGKIAEEGCGVAPAKANSFKFFRKCFGMLDKLLRGDGSHVSVKYWRSPEVWRSFEEDMKNDCKWFWDIFGTDIPLDEVKKTSDLEMASIWDTKRILDALETKSYLNWSREN